MPDRDRNSRPVDPKMTEAPDFNAGLADLYEKVKTKYASGEDWAIEYGDLYRLFYSDQNDHKVSLAVWLAWYRANQPEFVDWYNTKNKHVNNDFYFGIPWSQAKKEGRIPQLLYMSTLRSRENCVIE